MSTRSGGNGLNGTNGAAAPSKDHKRLIVLCDGTWVDSNSVGKVKYPTNVTRFARCIKAKYTTIDDDGHKHDRPQVIFYQPGVGSASGTVLRGGLYGSGVSATVRSAYAFLSHNYDIGDEIFFFGFSRGAYIARSIAGLVTSLGLLTKKGMDHFPLVYAKYYDHESHMTATGPDSLPFEAAHADFVGQLEKKGLLHKQAREAVQVVGVWDTVGFHAAGMFEEKIEFRNCELSPRVRCAYHALALDERREPFTPTPWRVPKKETVELAYPKGKDWGEQEMVQCWFSGRHSDVGGGLDDPRLSDITLAWMIAQVAKGGKLAFTDIDSKDDYLIDSEKTPGPEAEGTPWATSKGSANEPEWYYKMMRTFYSADRSPLTYLEEGRKVREASQEETHEYIHRSVMDRNLDGRGKGVQWVCNVLCGKTHGKTGAYGLARDETKGLPLAPKVVRDVEGPDGQKQEQDVEAYFKGRVVGIMGTDIGADDKIADVEKKLGNTGFVGME